MNMKGCPLSMTGDNGFSVKKIIKFVQRMKTKGYKQKFDEYEVKRPYRKLQCLADKIAKFDAKMNKPNIP